MLFFGVMIIIFFIGVKLFEMNGFTVGLTAFLSLSVCCAILCSVIEDSLLEFSRKLTGAYRYISTKVKFM